MNFSKWMFTRAEQRDLLEQWLMCEEDGLTVMQFCELLVKFGTDSSKKIGQEGLAAPGQGKTFSDVLTKWCDPVVVQIIAIAQHSGHLKLGIVSAINELSGGQNVMSRVAMICVMPLTMLCVMGGLSVYVSGEILGAIDIQYGFAFDMRAFLKSSGLVLLIGSVGLFLLMNLSMPYWKGPIRAFFDDLPLYSHYRIGVASGFLGTLSNLSNAGMNINDALTVMSEHSSRYLCWHIATMRDRLERESNIGRVLHTGLLLPRSQSNLEVLGDTSELTRLLTRAATYHHNEVTKRLNRIESILPKIILILAILLLVLTVGGAMAQLLGAVRM